MNSMRSAFLLLGIMSVIVYGGAFIVLHKKAEVTTLLNTNATKSMQFSLTSPAFRDDELIPSKYTCDGEGVSPELKIENIPEGTKSLILVMDDPDIPVGVKTALGIEKFDHWVLYNIPPETLVIPEGMNLGTSGLNSSGTTGYVGLCPPDREHRYFFRIYAISEMLNFNTAPTLDEVVNATNGILKGSATLMGRYERIKLP